MNRTNAHTELLHRLAADYRQERRQLNISVCVVIVFAAVAVAAVVSVQRELHYLFPAVIAIGITGMSASSAAQTVARIGNLTRQIEIIMEDTKKVN